MSPLRPRTAPDKTEDRWTPRLQGRMAANPRNGGRERRVYSNYVPQDGDGQ
jgi:hypothetical protein